MNQLVTRLSRPILALLAALVLASCGPSVSTDYGSSGSNNPSSTLVVGNVAVGQAVSGASITLTDAKGATRTATSLSTGGYSIDVTGMTPPFVVVARGVANSSNITLVSTIPTVNASVANVVNVTPLTTAIAAMLSSDGRAVDLSASQNSGTIATDFTSVDNYVVSLIAPTLKNAGLSSSADPVTTFFTSDGTGYDSIYDNIKVFQTSQGAVSIAPVVSNTAPLCSPNQISQCNPVYSDPHDQTTTYPNQCGSDIATGAPIPCDPALPVYQQPPNGVLPSPITLGSGSGAYTFGCSGCVFFGAADMPPPTNPLNITTVVKASSNNTGSSGSGSLPGFPSGLPSSGTYQLSGQICGTYIGCQALQTEQFSGVDPNTLENDVSSAIQSAVASAGGSGCGASDSFSSWNGSSFSATITITCSSGGYSATVTESLTITKIG